MQELVFAMQEHTAALRQGQAPSVTSLSSPASTSAAVAIPSTSAHGRSVLSLPVAYQTLLEAFIISDKLGQAFPYFVRQPLFVPAGTTGVLNVTIPSGDTATAVYLLRLTSNVYSQSVLVTFQADNFPPMFVEAPLMEPIDIEGAFLPPAHTQAVFTVTNNDSVDINFGATLQLAMMTADFAAAVYDPIVKGQFDLLQKLGAEFTASSGSLIL